MIGVLVAAKRAGHLTTIGPVLRQLEVDAGFYLGASLKDRVLRAVGEASPWVPPPTPTRTSRERFMVR